MKPIFNLINNMTNGQHIIMNTLKSNLFLLLLGVLAGTSLNAQEKQKGIATFVIYQEFDFPVETLWETVALDYGNIINSHPAIYSSVYTKGHTEGQLGAQRKLEFNKKGTKALTETIVSWDPENYTYNVQLDQADGFPINEEVTLATLTFKSLGPNRSSFQFDFSYGTCCLIVYTQYLSNIRGSLRYRRYCHCLIRFPIRCTEVSYAMYRIDIVLCGKELIPFISS